MAKHYFTLGHQHHLDQIQREIINWFKNRQYEVESKIFSDRHFIQAKKTNMIRTFLGANLAFKINLYESPHPSSDREVVIETSLGKWVTNIAGAGFASLFMGGIPILTGIANAGWALLLEKELISDLENALSLRPVQPTPYNSSYSSPPSYSAPNSPNTTVDVSASTVSSAREKAEAKVREDLGKLQQALEVGIIDRITFNKKKDKLEEKIDRYEAEFILEEKLEKLQKAFSAGILDTVEYETKVQELQDRVDSEIIQKRGEKRKTERAQKLKEAWENGILTEAEYYRKLEEL